MRVARPVVALVAATLCGCDSIVGADCSGPALAGLRVNVLDAATRRALDSLPVVTIHDGQYSEQLSADPFATDQRSFIGGVERPGRYQLRVEAAGYLPVVHEGVRVTQSGRCDAVEQITTNIWMAALP